MAVTPEQEALNARICELPIIVALQEKDAEIIDDLEGLKEGQEKLSHTVSEGFAKGKQRMDGIEGEVREVKDELKELKGALINGLKDVISEVRDQKLTELKNELKDRKNSDNGLKNDVIKIIIVTVISAIGYLFIKAFG